MENLKIGENEFRVKKMNAIEALAFRNIIDFDSYDGIVKFFNIILENEEVKFEGNWLPVKEKNKNIYYPNGIEDDLNTINKLIEYFRDYLNAVFIESTTSKKEQK